MYLCDFKIKHFFMSKQRGLMNVIENLIPLLERPCVFTGIGNKAYLRHWLVLSAGVRQT